MMKITGLATVSIAISRSTDGGNNWSAPVVHAAFFLPLYTSADRH